MAREHIGSAAPKEDVVSGDTDRKGIRKVLTPTDQVCAITDSGRVRDHNEDTFYISNDSRVFIVADGMGGHEGGEVASTLATQAVIEVLSPERRAATQGNADAVERLLREALETAHSTVLEKSRNAEQYAGMGATLLVTYVAGDQLWCCHVGDVRCYVSRPSGLEQITDDHSVVGALVRGGQLTAEQARVHPKKNEVLQAIGMPQPLAPEINCRALEEGDRVLLCSDGLWEGLPDEDIGAIAQWEGSMRQLATQFLDRANDAGGYDNITLVLYEHRRRSGAGG